MGVDEVLRALQVTVENLNTGARELIAFGGIADEGSDDVPACDRLPGDGTPCAIGEIDGIRFCCVAISFLPFNPQPNTLTDGQSILVKNSECRSMTSMKNALG